MGKLFEFAANHPFLSLATLGMLLAVIFYELRLKATGLTAIGPSQAVRMINQGARIIDIRDKEQFDQGHIVDAVHVPADQLAEHVSKKLKAAKPFIVVCDSGTRSGQAVATLR